MQQFTITARPPKLRWKKIEKDYPVGEAMRVWLKPMFADCVSFNEMTAELLAEIVHGTAQYQQIGDDEFVVHFLCLHDECQTITVNQVQFEAFMNLAGIIGWHLPGDGTIIITTPDLTVTARPNVMWNPNK